MPLPIITDTIRVAVEGGLGDGATWANILHFRKTSALTNVGAIAILDPKLLALYTTVLGGGVPWRNYAATSAHLSKFVFTPLDGVTASTQNAHSSNGALVEDELPGNVALCISLHTARRGRSYRGRCYWCGFGYSTNGPLGVPGAARVTNYQTQWTAFLASLAGSGVSLVVASYLHSTAEDVTTVTIDPRWDSQRRRLG